MVSNLEWARNMGWVSIMEWLSICNGLVTRDWLGLLDGLTINLEWASNKGLRERYGIDNMGRDSTIECVLQRRMVSKMGWVSNMRWVSNMGWVSSMRDGST